MGEIIPSKIGENLTKISYLENELKKLKEDTIVLQKKGQGFYDLNVRKILPQLVNFSCRLKEEEQIATSKVQDIIDNLLEHNIEGTIESNEELDESDDKLNGNSLKSMDEFISLNDSLKVHNNCEFVKLKELKKTIESKEKNLEQMRDLITSNEENISHYHYDSKEFFSSIVNLKNGGIAEFTNIQNNYFKLDYFTRLDKLNFLNEEEKTVFKSFFQNFNPSFKGEYLLSPPITELLDKSRTQEPPLSLLFNICELSPFAIDKLKSM